MHLTIQQGMAGDKVGSQAKSALVPFCGLERASTIHTGNLVESRPLGPKRRDGSVKNEGGKDFPARSCKSGRCLDRLRKFIRRKPCKFIRGRRISILPPVPRWDLLR